MNKQYNQFSSINNYLNVPLCENITAPVFSSSESLACHWTPQEHPYLNSNHLSFTTLSRFKRLCPITLSSGAFYDVTRGTATSLSNSHAQVCVPPSDATSWPCWFDPFQTPGRSSKVTTECFVGGFMFYALFEASLAHSLRKSKRSENKYDSLPLKCK